MKTSSRLSATTTLRHDAAWRFGCRLVLIFPLLLNSPARAQLADNQTAVMETELQPVSQTLQPAEKDADSQVWHRIDTLRDSKGNTVLRTNIAYVELQTGMFYREEGQWKESREVIESYPGGAIARQGGHKVIFAGDFRSEIVVDMETPGGKRLQSRVLGLAYVDSASGKSVWLAEATNSIGQIINTNQVLYADAFSGAKASVRFTYTKAGLEQDVILVERPATPESFGLDSKTTTLQVMTEFLSPPQPVVTTNKLGEFVGGDEDHVLDFGAMQMGQGKAFSIGLEEATADEVPVKKQWTVTDGRTILVEQVAVARIANQLESLPVKKRTAFFWNKQKKAVQQTAALKLKLPARTTVKSESRPMRMAKLNVPVRGVVLDYLLLSSQANFTFKGDTTYYVSASVNLSGTTTNEGAVVKFANSAGARINVGGSGLVCQTGPYRPAIFTSKDDDSVGDMISGSSHAPTTTTATYLHVLVGNNPFKYLHFRYAGIALSQSYRPVWHCQFVNCNIAITGDSQNSYGSTLELHNVLFTKCTTAIRNQPAYWTGSCLAVAGEHVTADQITQFMLNGCYYGGPASSLVNSILTSYGSLGVTLSLINSIDNPDPGSSSGFYQSSGAGNYYLTDLARSTLGTSAINPTLLAELAKKTTHPPEVHNSGVGPITIPSGISWSQFASRDTGTPEIGYHYDPLDHFVGNATLSGTLTVAEGTAVGFFGPYGFQSGTLKITGTPLNRSTVAHYSAVQEQPIAWGANASASYLLKSGSMPTLHWRFADVSTAGGAFLGGGTASTMDVAHCSLFVPRMTCDGGYYATLGFTNNIIERGDLVLLSCYGGTYYANFYNNLFLNNGNLGLGHACNGNILPNFAVKNNLFIKGSFTYGTSSGYAPVISHNGYYQTTVTSQGTSSKTINNTPDFVTTGPLGPYYYPLTGGNLSQLIDAGSAAANVLGLCPFTVRTDQTPEGVSQVDIGFHYVALAQGIPLDINGNGPDYDETPVANPQSLQTCRDTMLPITLDGSGSICGPLTFSLVTGPTHGVLGNITPIDDTSAGVIYTPNAPFLFCGNDSFTFKVRNNGRDSAPATVTVAVGNPDPVANCADVLAEKNPTVKTITLSGSDICDDALTFTVLPGTGPFNGVLGTITQVDDTHATVTYTPNSGFEGTDTFDFIVNNCGFSSPFDRVTINVVPAPVLITTCRSDRIILHWSVPQGLGNSYFKDFRIYRCETTAPNCAPADLYATVTDSSARTFVDMGVQANKTYCYRVTFRHQNICDNSAVPYESPFSNEDCNQVCSPPVTLISGNNYAFGSGPIETFDYATGNLLNSFVPDGATVGEANGRGIAIQGTEIFYSELANRFEASDGIHVAPYGTQGSGGTDIRILPNPNPTAGIAALAFHNSTLYALTGYPDQQIQVFKLEPSTGAVIGSPISIGSPATDDADGFTVLPNGNFLINDRDQGPIYREYSGTTGNLVSSGLVIDLKSFGFLRGTGVATAADGQSLYFIADVDSPQTFVQTDLAGNLMGFQIINTTSIEDIDVVKP